MASPSSQCCRVSTEIEFTREMDERYRGMREGKETAHDLVEA